MLGGVADGDEVYLHNGLNPERVLTAEGLPQGSPNDLRLLQFADERNPGQKWTLRIKH